MLDALFNEEVSLRRLTGKRDGHGKPELAVVTDGPDSDVPAYIECYIERRRRSVRLMTATSMVIDATLIYNKDAQDAQILENDLVVTSLLAVETYRVSSLDEQAQVGDGTNYGRLGLTLIRRGVEPNSNKPSEVDGTD